MSEGSGYILQQLVPMLAVVGLGSLKLEYDANKNPAIFQQLCELQLDKVIQQASERLQCVKNRPVAAPMSSVLKNASGITSQASHDKG